MRCWGPQDMLRYYGSLVSTLGPTAFCVGGNFGKPHYSACLWHTVVRWERCLSKLAPMEPLEAVTWVS